ncbi:MAG: ATP-binding protein [Anaerolineae bacterium]|nr:ATP-binding protein [Anaerolineae bacterium]
MSTTLPYALRALERLRHRIRGPQTVRRLDTFTVDLSAWKLSLSDRTPCIWVHSHEHLNLPAVDLAYAIRDVVRQQGWEHTTVLVLVDGTADELRQQLSRLFTTQFVIWDAKQQKEIFDASSPTRLMLDLFLEQIPRAQLSPYETSRWVTGSRFFGRSSDLKKIRSRPSNFMIFGIRRIGKTSLLREVERLLDEEDPPTEGSRRHVYIECSTLQTPDDFYREVAAKFQAPLKLFLERKAQSFRNATKMFDYLASEQRGQITFLLDEFDRLLEYTQHNLDFCTVLRQASQNKRARFIMAGFREMRRAMYNREHPFYNFGEPLYLEALERKDVAEMITQPFDALRVKLDGREEIVSRIFRETAGQPLFVQFYCQTLLEQLDRSEGNVISINDFQSVYDNTAFRDIVLTTFMDNSVPLERAIVFAMVGVQDKHEREVFTIEDLDAELKRRGLVVTFNRLDEACRNLDTANILRRQGKAYSFRLPLFVRMLQENYSVEFGFKKARQEYMAQDGETRR